MTFKRFCLFPCLSFVCSAGLMAALDGRWLKYATALMMAVGCGLNYACIYMNNGRMPVKGRTANHENGVHGPMLNSSKLKFLADIYDIPKVGVASIGDLVMLLGVLISIIEWFA